VAVIRLTRKPRLSAPVAPDSPAPGRGNPRLRP
jgi:hypothetical protein